MGKIRIDNFNNLRALYSKVMSHKTFNYFKDLTDIYESCVFNQVRNNCMEEILLPRALYFARALESLFENDGMKSKVNEIKKDEFQKLQWLLFFEDPQTETIKKWFSSNQTVAKKYLKGISHPDFELSIGESFHERTVETVQEQETKQLTEQINQTKIVANSFHNFAVSPNPSLILCTSKSDKSHLSLIRASTDWRNTYFNFISKSFDQGKVPIFLAGASELKNIDDTKHALISQAEAEKLFSKGDLVSVFTIGTLGFDNVTLEIELKSLLQYLSFSGSFSTFFELLEEWALFNPEKKDAIFGTIIKIFHESEDLKDEFLTNSSLYEKRKSFSSFQLFMTNYSQCKHSALSTKEVIVIIEPDISNTTTFMNKLRFEVKEIGVKKEQKKIGYLKMFSYVLLGVGAAAAILWNLIR